MKLGICYYPEHWPEARWAADAAWLKTLGISIVRMAEFAWSRLEPAEGRFDWAWLDRAVDVFAREGFEVVLGTPTAAPPDWLSHHYPSTLPVDSQGRRRRPGGRRHYCPNNADYRDHTRRMVTALAERYGRHPAVVGWQIDNEFGGGDTARCYCPVCADHFRRWVQARYGQLEALNAAWGAVFWSAEYHDWAHLEPPILHLAKPNPSLVLDYYRFCSDSVVNYQQFQIDLLRERVPAAHFITHNFMGLYPDLNYFDLARPLSFVAWDSYPTGNADRWRPMLYGDERPPAYAFDVGDPDITAFAHDLTRGLSGQPFWIMEQQPGHVNWGQLNPLIRPGTVRLWTWHAAAAGADAVVYFRERAALDAQEQYHSGLLHHDGTPDVGYRDVERLRGERALLEALTAGPPRAEAALRWSYDDLWALQQQPHSREFSYLRHLFVYYRALQRLGLPVDIVPPGRALTGYKLFIAPTLHLAGAEEAARLRAFAEAGGVVLLGVRSGFKTGTNRVTDQPLPGPLRDLVGATVTDWGALPPDLSGLNSPWIEALEPQSARVLRRHTSGPYAGRVALTENAVGAGRVLYCGWFPTVDQAQALLADLAAQAGLARLVDEPLPPGLLACRRGAHTVLLNFTDEPRQAHVLGRVVRVGARDVAVLSERAEA